jgi:hypothetical protein
MNSCGYDWNRRSRRIVRNRRKRRTVADMIETEEAEE